MFLRNNFLLYLTAIFIAFAMVILPNNALANGKDVLEELTKKITQSPNVAVNYNDRGWIYFALGDYVNAEKDFKKAIELNKDQTYSYRGLGHVYRATRKNNEAEKYFIEYGNRHYKLEEAIEGYTAAIELNDKNAETYVLRGQIYYKKQDYDKALDDFNKAITINDKSADAYRGRALVYTEKGADYKESAKENFLKSGKQYYNDKNYEDARTDLNKVIELDEKSGEAYFYFGQIEFELKNYTEAAKRYKKSVDYGFKTAAAYFDLGLSWYNLKNYEEALKGFDEAINLNSKYARAYRWRGESYYKLKDSDKLSSFTQYLYKWNAASDFKQYLELKEELKENLDEKTKLDYQNKIEECKTPLDGLFNVLEIFGEFNTIFKVLLIAIVLDYVIIIACGLRAGTLTAGVAAQEFFKEVIILLVVAVVNAFENVDTLKNLDVRDFVIAIILLYQLYYITENSERLGVPVPDWLKEMLKTIREKIESIFTRR